MTLLQAVLLGVLQGIAEFLPISSSGHLEIAHTLFKLNDVPLLFNIMLHLATLVAVVLFFRKQIVLLLCVCGRFITRRPRPEDKSAQKMILAILCASAVTAVFGLVLSRFIPDLPLKVICVGFLCTAALLVFSSICSNRAPKTTENTEISIKQGLLTGLAQGIGVLPGISRSGITISAALFTGVDRKTAGEFSFLLSIPAILGAFLLELKDLDTLAASVSLLPLIAGCIAAFVSGIFSLMFLMKLIRKGQLFWFALYLVPAGLAGLFFL